MKGRIPITVETDDGPISVKPSQISQTSERAAKRFGARHALTDDAMRKLAALLEVTWQDGTEGEKAFSFLEGIARAAR